jgi:hypothetical protein
MRLNTYSGGPMTIKLFLGPYIHVGVEEEIYYTFEKIVLEA